MRRLLAHFIMDSWTSCYSWLQKLCLISIDWGRITDRQTPVFSSSVNCRRDSQSMKKICLWGVYRLSICGAPPFVLKISIASEIATINANVSMSMVFCIVCARQASLTFFWRQSYGHTFESYLFSIYFDKKREIGAALNGVKSLIVQCFLFAEAFADKKKNGQNGSHRRKIGSRLL